MKKSQLFYSFLIYFSDIFFLYERTSFPIFSLSYLIFLILNSFFPNSFYNKYIHVKTLKILVLDYTYEIYIYNVLNHILRIAFLYMPFHFLHTKNHLFFFNSLTTSSRFNSTSSILTTEILQSFFVSFSLMK